MRIAVIGDYGAEGGGLVAVASMVASWHPDQVLTVGDNVYSSMADPYDALVGQYYHQFIWPYSGAYGAGSATGTNRFWPIPGNHDYDHANLAPYLAFFTLPNNEYYYSQYLDPAQKVRLFALSADDRTPAGNTATSTQGIWLQTNMSNDHSSCFKILAEHEPPYCSTIGQSEGNDLTMQWPYEAWGADMVMSGSRHGFERLSVDGIPYLVNGLGGGALWGDWNIIEPHSVYRFPTTPQRYGAELITINIANGVGTLTGQFYGVSDGGPADTVPSDTFTLTKACN
jgi:Calcineurin-like phosphoesterase